MKDKIVKYFELPIQEIKTWSLLDYVLFVVESLYTTVFPFISGMLLVKRQELVWIFMLILPIYFRLKFVRKFDNSRNKRVYIK
jgi:hypothetical protein